MQEENPPVAGGQPVPPPLPSEGEALHPSCTAPLAAAWRRMVSVLFRPFHAGKWFALGFCAWLATLGQPRGFGGMNFRLARKLLDDRGAFSGELVATLGTAEAFQSVPLVLFFVMGALFIVFLALLLGLLLLWIRCRGKFMFLYNVVGNCAQISHPWRRFARQGNSLFVWMLLYELVSFSVAALLLTATVVITLGPIRMRDWQWHFLPGVSGLILLWFLFGVARIYINRFLNDFVVLLMYRDGLSTAAAWRRFAGILSPHLGHFLLYGVFYFLVKLAIVALIAVVVLATCCIAGCLLALPYLGTVLLLPALVFLRSYSVEYLGQFGPQYRVNRAGERSAFTEARG